MNKCAFCIPLHPKHYEYAKYIAKEINNSDADLYFIFTDQKDKDQFECDSKYGSLILTDFTDLAVVEKTESFITIKKYYALSCLKKKYEYIACIDAEVKFIKTDGFYSIMRDVAESKTLFGSFLDTDNHGRTIVYKSLMSITPPEDHNNLAEISRLYSVYTWWSNLPVYKSRHMDHFLSWIHFDNSTLERFNWSVFDHMLYNFYCVLFHNYTIKLSDKCKTSFEFLDSKTLEYVDSRVKLYWVNKKAYDENPEYYNKRNFFIIYHCDR